MYYFGGFGTKQTGSSRKTSKEVVDKNKNALHLKPSHAMDRSKWKEWWEGTRVTATVTVTLRAEYELHISGAGSPRLTWIKGR